MTDLDLFWKVQEERIFYPPPQDWPISAEEEDLGIEDVKEEDWEEGEEEDYF